MSVFKGSFWGGGKKAGESWDRVGQVWFPTARPPLVTTLVCITRSASKEWIFVGPGGREKGRCGLMMEKQEVGPQKFAFSLLFPGRILSDCSRSCNPEAGLLGPRNKTHWCFSFLCLTVKCISYLKKQSQRTDKPNRSGRLGIRILFF